MNWLTAYLEPLNRFLEHHPYPPYQRVRGCDPMRTTHIEHRCCCNGDIWKKYKEWHSLVLKPQHNNIYRYL